MSAPPVVVDVWLAPVEPAMGERWSAGLSESDLAPDERARARRFVRPELGRAFARGRLFLRAVLARCLGIPPVQVRLTADARGKPRLEGPAAGRLDFNVSHSGGWLAVATADGVPVGIDLEQLRAVRDALAIARRFFPAPEAERLAELPAAERGAAFFAAWTLKEALAKADGRGIALFGGLATGIAPVSPPGRQTAIDGTAFAAATFEAPAGTLGAVAVRGEAVAVNRRDLDAP